MKYIRLYEDLDGPQVGDYVVCKETMISVMDIDRDEVIGFTSNNIGKIIEKQILTSKTNFIVKYKNVPEKLECHFNERNNKHETSVRLMFFEEVLFYSKSESECEAYLASKKYNI